MAHELSLKKTPTEPAGLPGRFAPWRVGVFVLIFALLQLGWQSARGTWLEYLIVHTCTVRPATWAANVLTPEIHAKAVGYSIRATHGGLNILNGCEGLEAMFLLAAAFAVTPLPWRNRLLGLGFGLAVVFVVNQARILGLLYAYPADRELFDALHGIVAPIGVVLLVGAYFHGWLSLSARTPRAA